jgi:hypothetical protein
MTSSDLIKIGDRVRLRYTSDPFTKLVKGTCGKVFDITKIPDYLTASDKPQYQIWVRWEDSDNHVLAMVPGIGDLLEVVKPE